MSRSAGKPSLDLSLKVKAMQVIEKLGYLPSEVTGALRVRVADMVLHQRLETGKRVGLKFPSQRKAQKRFFARSFQYSKAADLLREVQGEAFLVGGEENPAKRGRDFWDLLQSGGVIQSRTPMFIPFSPAAAKIWAKTGFGDIIPNKKEPKLNGRVVVELGRVGQRGRALKRDSAGYKKDPDKGFRAGDFVGGFRTEIVGVLRKTRRQPKLLQWFESYEKIAPQHAAAMEKVLDDVLSFDGRRRVAEETEKLRGQIEQRLRRVYGRSDRGLAKQAVRDGASVSAKTRLSPASLGIANAPRSINTTRGAA